MNVGAPDGFLCGCNILCFCICFGCSKETSLWLKCWLQQILIIRTAEIQNKPLVPRTLNSRDLSMFENCFSYSLTKTYVVGSLDLCSHFC